MAITLPLSNIGGRYFAMFLMTLGTYCAFNCNASHFFTPYMFPSSDSPRYRSGGIALAVFCVGTMCTALSIKFVLKKLNKKMRDLDENDEEYTGVLEGIPRGYVFST
ncbi:uncharacterized protein IL334_005899 [Kwoniella shivajii]|uniref:Uncharacterized protein n=1 Tax=Kwoniella shivajii TaxID=564305 RepID=A0ABZ1D4E8_9TREE|nr:hypothetical protein IL334_005899 [Kwoniella shivajii]